MRVPHVAAATLCEAEDIRRERLPAHAAREPEVGRQLRVQSAAIDGIGIRACAPEQLLTPAGTKRTSSPGESACPPCIVSETHRCSLPSIVHTFLFLPHVQAGGRKVGRKGVRECPRVSASGRKAGRKGGRECKVAASVAIATGLWHVWAPSAA